MLRIIPMIVIICYILILPILNFTGLNVYEDKAFKYLLKINQRY